MSNCLISQVDDNAAASEEPSELPKPESREEITEENKQDEENEDEGYLDLR